MDLEGNITNLYETASGEIKSKPLGNISEIRRVETDSVLGVQLPTKAPVYGFKEKDGVSITEDLPSVFNEVIILLI